MRAHLSVETLIDGQFSFIGSWKLDEVASLVLAGVAPGVPGVYAFAVNGIVQYVGVASTSLAKRLYFYRKPGPSQKTNIRLNASLRDILAQGSIVDIYVASPPDLQWNGWSVSGAEGLEAGIIKAYTLPLNMQGASPVAHVAGSEPVRTVEILEPARMAATSDAMQIKNSMVREQSMPLRTISGSKYLALCDFLHNYPQDKISMTFAQIEQLVGPLPKSAMLHRAWWANHEGNTQAKGWMPARFLAEPDPAHRTVVFRRFH